MPAKTEFDPAEFLLTEDGEIPQFGFNNQIYQHRHALFKLFKKAHPESKIESSEIQKELFLEFINQITYDIRISYSIIGWLLHIYYIYWSASRIFSCGGRWALTCDARPFTMVDVSGWIQFIFYFLGIIPVASIQQTTFYYLSYAMNGTLFLVFLSVKSDHGWFLDGGEKLYGTWNAVYIPILYYWMFVLIFTSKITLSSWILSDFRRFDSTSLDVSWAKPIHRLNKWLWLPTYFMLHFAVFIAYSAFRPLFYSEFADAVIPGKFWLLLYGVFMGMTSSAWVSFLTFQHQFMVWTNYWESGLVVFEFDGQLSIGVLY